MRAVVSERVPGQRKDLRTIRGRMCANGSSPLTTRASASEPGSLRRLQPSVAGDHPVCLFLDQNRVRPSVVLDRSQEPGNILLMMARISRPGLEDPDLDPFHESHSSHPPLFSGARRNAGLR